MAFLRRNAIKHSKFGKRRKKKQVWRKPKGRDNKMREKRKGKPPVVSIGYQKPKSEKKHVKIIQNLNDFEKIKENDMIIFGNIGKRKKLEIAKKAYEKKIPILNLNVKKFLEKNTKEEKKNESK